mgnify:FL=1
MSTPSSNFAFLTKLHPLWAELGSVAERVFPIDPRSCVVKMRLLAEDMARDMAIQVGIQPSAFDSQLALVRELENRLRLDAKVRDMLHLLRKRGNEAAHQADAPIGFTEGLEVLKIGRELALWYHRTFDNQPDYRPGPFIPPDNPSRKLSELQKQVQNLDQQLEQTRTQQAQHQALLAQREAALQAQLAQEQEMTRQAEAAYAQAEEESSVYRQLAEEGAALAERLKTESAEQEERLKQQLARQEEENARLKERQEALEQKLLAQGQTPTGALPVDVPLVAAGSTATPLAASVQADRDARLKQLIERANQAARQVDLDEAATRLLIDDQLRQAGWEADSQTLHYAKGTRPQEGKNLAIAEWPMPSQGQRGHPEQADYVLFIGLMPVAIVEAKRFNTAVASYIGQAERYARAFRMENEVLTLPWQAASLKAPWPDGIGSSFQLPYAYACNGRAYIQQHLDSSGIHFRDLRRPCNIAHALRAFHSPEELKAMLGQDIEQAEKALQEQADDYGELSLRYYQKDAIKAIETALAHQQRTALVAMATGTGKTRTCLGLIYRMLRTQRFRRILFLVDRSALAEQALETFSDEPLDRSLTLADIYNIAGLHDKAPKLETSESGQRKVRRKKTRPTKETQVEVTTVQTMVRRLLDDENRLSAGVYDCIIVDEAHRGYTPDQEMTEGELIFRDQQDYQSTYRRVLDHFDAVKIALTATPAKHTTEIFGIPIYEYSYRKAVADGFLVDHEPPVRYLTQLNQHGIHFQSGEDVEYLDTGTGQIERAKLADELNFDVATFNRSVLNENFNRVICQALAEDIPLPSDEKTLIFCVNDRHADTVKRLLNEAYKARYGKSFRQTWIEKITGRADKPDKLIRRFKNEADPTIAITVDLLTTGIDVPAICNLVFLRKVKSRILYEQMLGRATRLCPEIGKEVFRIHDAVDLYATLQSVTDMQPLVKDPSITLERLAAELMLSASDTAPATAGSTIQEHQRDIAQQFIQKTGRLMTRVSQLIQRLPDLKPPLDELGRLINMPPADLPSHLRALLRSDAGTAAITDYLRAHPQLVPALTCLHKAAAGGSPLATLSSHKDQLQERARDYGGYTRPEDYLDAFRRFIREQINQSTALNVIVHRPRDMTRAQLCEVTLLLDQHRFGMATLQKAWNQHSNQDMAAGIVAYIRQAALGEALIPFRDRVDNAMTHIYALRHWTPNQRTWLERIAKQLKSSTQAVVDADFLQEVTEWHGGPERLNGILEDQLETVRDTLASHLWGDTA